MKILDCSIRDGGHLNKWKFSPEIVKATYKAAKSAGVDVCEIGYRYPDTLHGLGYFGYSLDDIIRDTLEKEVSPNCKIALMIDSGKCETHQFRDKKDSLVSVVRVAAYPYELEKAIWQVEELHDKGYLVFLNPMASSELTRDNFTFLKNWKQKHIVEGIYFADSFGAFLPVDVPLQLRKFQDAGYPSVGFHAHNNLQLAVANTLEAVNAGAEWIDATVMGIGRGAGNAPIEIVLGLLNRTLRTDYRIAPYLEVAHKYYNEVREELNWAVRPETVMGGLKNVHPYYMDDLFSRKIPIDDIWNIADRVKTDCPISYSATAVDNLLLDIGGIPHDRI